MGCCLERRGGSGGGGIGGADGIEGADCLLLLRSNSLASANFSNASLYLPLFFRTAASNLSFSAVTTDTTVASGMFLS